MNADERCAQLVQELKRLGVPCLVMGGHAVRFYGIQRGTIDFDLVVDSNAWPELGERLSSSGLFHDHLSEGESWRPEDFRRFQIGTLHDGRPERLEFWKRNHLLAPFELLWSRRRMGLYGGEVLDFLGLHDLIRSKETERDEDWRDMLLLEEIADDVSLSGATETDRVEVLAGLRSHRGFATARQRGLLDDESWVASAVVAAKHPVTLAFLIPFAPARHTSGTQVADPAIREILDHHLPGIAPASARHLALVEAVRRLYKKARMLEDRADKILARTPVR